MTKNTKRIIVSIFSLFAIGCALLPAALSEAKEVKTISASEKDGIVSVSGAAEDGTLAVAIMIYDQSGKNLLAMETAAVSDDSTYAAEIELASGTYVVKVADYDGGDYKTTTVTPSEKTVIPDAPNSGAI